MDKRAFKRRVISEASKESLSDHNVDAAINVNVSQGKTQEKHVEECVFLALSYEIESASEKEDEVELKHYFPPHVFPTSQGELLVKQVESWIESIRRELFGKDQPPFKSYPDAVRWMKQEAKKRPKPSKKDQKRVQELDTEILDKQKKRNRLTRQSGMSICWEALSIPYVDFPVSPDSWVEILPVSFDKPLGPLAYDSKKIAETTGFRQVAVVAWILAGERPVIPGARLYIPVSPTWTLTPAGEIFTRQARIDIFSPDLKPSEIVELYKKAQDYLRPFHLSARNRALLEIMEELGDLEDGQEKRAYWETVRLEYNRSRPPDTKPYATWEGPRKAFIRLEPIYKKPYPRLEGRENLKELFKATFIRQGHSAEEAEQMAEIAAKGGA